MAVRRVGRSARNEGRDNSRGTRRGLRLRWVIVPAVVLVVAWLGLAALLALRAVSHLQAGEAAVARARGEVSASALAAGTATPDLNTAAADFASAHDSLDSGWLAPLRVAPWLGRQLRSADALAGAAAAVTGDGRQSLAQVRSLMAAPHATPEQRTAVVRQLAGALSGLRARLDHVDLGPSDALLPTLAAKRATFARDLAQVRSAVDEGSAAAAAVSDLLSGPRTYLVLSANNAEMRAGSGMFLQAETLSTSNGKLTLGGFTSTADLSSPTPLAPIDGTLRSLWGYEKPNQEWRNLALSPQFPANAALAAAMWQAEKGVHVDGVLALDVGALQDLLAVTGPVDLAGRQVSAGDASDVLFRQQYVGVTDAGNGARREALGALAAGVFARLESGDLSLTGLTRAVADAAGGRHLLAWSADPAVEADWQAAGVGGVVSGPDVLLSVMNQGANKLDPYQRVEASLTATPQGPDTEVVVRMTETNRTPTGLPPYVEGTQGSAPGTYTGVASLDFPSEAGYVSVAGGSKVVAAGPDGSSQVLATGITLPRGSSTTVTWKFSLSGHHGQLRVLPSARMPATTWTVTTPGVRQPGHFDDSAPHTVTW